MMSELISGKVEKTNEIVTKTNKPMYFVTVGGQDFSAIGKLPSGAGKGAFVEIAYKVVGDYNNIDTITVGKPAPESQSEGEALSVSSSALGSAQNVIELVSQWTKIRREWEAQNTLSLEKNPELVSAINGLYIQLNRSR